MLPRTLGTLGLAVLMASALLAIPATTRADDFQRGDFSGDGAIDVGDVIAILSYLSSGDGGECDDAGDLDDSGTINIGDAVYLLHVVFHPDGPLILAPTSCGADPTPDALDCATYTPCP